MQETCLRLMGKKMLVALMMEGKFSGEGLQALDPDVERLSAMARDLVLWNLNLKRSPNRRPTCRA
jgi:hypothetical protein